MTSTVKWNSTFPVQVGQEHDQPGYGSVPIDENVDRSIAAFSFVASETATVDSFSFFASLARGKDLGARFGNLNSPMVVELFEDNDATSFAYNISEYSPAIITGVSMWNENLTTASVDRIVSQGDGKYLVAQFNNSSWVTVQFGGGLSTFPLDRTPIIVQPVVRTNAFFRLSRHDPGQPGVYHWFNDVPALNPSGYTNFYLSNGEAKNDWGTSDWTLWTAEELRDFGRVNRERAFTVWCRSGGGGFWKLDRVWLRVYWVNTPRIAYGVRGISNDDNRTWVDFPIVDASTGGSVTLTQGQRYTVLGRRIWDYHEYDIADSMYFSPRYINTRSVATNWEPRTITNYMRPPSYGERSEVVDEDAGLYCAYFSNGGVPTEMTQPYTLPRGMPVRNNTDVFVEQTVTVTGSATTEIYGQVIASVGWRAGSKPPSSAVLRCEVFESDGDRVLGATDMPMYEIDRIPLDNTQSSDQGTQFRRVPFLFDNGKLLPTGTYTIRITVPGVLLDESEFEIHALTARDVPDLESATFGAGDIVDGATDYATGYIYAGSPVALSGVGPTGSDPFRGDASLILTTVPPPPETITSSHGVITTHKAEICPTCNRQTKQSGEQCTGCGEHGLPFGHISWSALDAEDAAYYEVSRRDDLSPDWEIVSRVPSTQTYWSDYEARVGVQSEYRVRGISTGDIPGLWSETTALVVSTYGGNPSMPLMFSSNAAVQMSCVYPEVFGDGEVERQFDFLEADDVVFGKIYGRERQVAFHPVERAGIQFSRTLLLNAVCSVSPPTMDVFRPLRDLSWASIPYVCVRDGEGNRWYANLRVTRGINRRPGEMWYVTVEITEISATPYIYNASDPQVESVAGGPA